jgi:hypothetical protein
VLFCFRKAAELFRLVVPLPKFVGFIYIFVSSEVFTSLLPSAILLHIVNITYKQQYEGIEEHMAKGKRLAVGEKAEVYSTKVLPSFKLLLGAQVMALGPTAGQRELLEEMHRVYVEKYPDRAGKALEILGLVNPQAAESARTYLGDTPVMTEVPPAAAAETEKQRLVRTVRYIGRPQVHLYELGSKNSTGCGLAGHIDPDTISEQTPDAVDCKKCRYCRKAVFTEW